VEIRKRLGSPDLSNSLESLSTVLLYRGELAEAETLKREGLEMVERHAPPRDAPYYEQYLVRVAAFRINLAFVLHARGDLAEAEPLFRDALEISRRVNKGDHPTVAWALCGLARVLQARGDLAGAEPMFRESLEMFRRLSPGDHPSVAFGLAGLASVLQERGDLESAEPLFRESMEMRERLLGKESRDTLFSAILLGGLRVAQGNHADALTLLVPIEDKARELFTGGNAYELASLLMNLGKARAGLARDPADFAAAEASLLEAHADLVKAPGPFPKDTRDCTQALADFYTMWDKTEPGKGYAARAAEWKAKLDADPGAR
jgi:tetratricopeptide (TPR) repeat protein